MTRHPHHRVRLSKIDWLGIAAIAVVMVGFVVSTFFTVLDLASTSRERLAIVETRVNAIENNVGKISADVRTLEDLVR